MPIYSFYFNLYYLYYSLTRIFEDLRHLNVLYDNFDQVSEIHQFIEDHFEAYLQKEVL